MSNFNLIPLPLPSLLIQDCDSAKSHTPINKRPLSTVSPHLKSTATFDTSSVSFQLSSEIALHSTTHLSLNETRKSSNYQLLSSSNALKRQKLNTSISVNPDNNINKNLPQPSYLGLPIVTETTSQHIENRTLKSKAKNHHKALQVPEILSSIFSYLEDPSGKSEDDSSLHTITLHNGVIDISNPQGPLFNCSLVNKQWNETANRLLHRNLNFDNLDKWNRFNFKSDSSIITKKLALCKLPLVGGDHSTKIRRLGGNLEWFELYMCPSILPPIEVFTPSLRHIILPGCIMVNDSILYAIGSNCPDLETLDLRACNRITDQGLKFIARTCRKLKMLNIGQTLTSPNAITHESIKEIARYTSVTTLGVSGCAITDQTVLEIALYRGKTLERLSLNNCKLLTNESIPRILSYVPNLSVLEIRGCINITHMRPILEFKRFQQALGRSPLIEGCSVINRRLQETEWLLTMEVSRHVLSHCMEWIYRTDNDKNSWPSHSIKDRETTEITV